MSLKCEHITQFSVPSNHFQKLQKKKFAIKFNCDSRKVIFCQNVIFEVKLSFNPFGIPNSLTTMISGDSDDHLDVSESNKDLLEFLYINLCGV